MSCNCCETNKKPPHKLTCPACQQLGDSVGTTTLLHHISTPWKQTLSDEQYYFCSQKGCEVVYFSAKGDPFTEVELRQQVGQKSTSETRTLCYCFDVRQEHLASADSLQLCREFIIEKTRKKLCSCETHNPSGRCCLHDFPKEKE